MTKGVYVTPITTGSNAIGRTSLVHVDHARGAQTEAGQPQPKLKQARSRGHGQPGCSVALVLEEFGWFGKILEEFM